MMGVLTPPIGKTSTCLTVSLGVAGPRPAARMVPAVPPWCDSVSDWPQHWVPW